MRDLVRMAAVAAVLLWSAGASAQQLYVYPQKGQSPDQQSRDEGECQAWAKRQTGYDPMNPPQVSGGSAPSSGVVKGAARGALLGVAAGAIAGDAGKGAAIGAASGGLLGGMRRNDQIRQQQSSQSQQAAQIQAMRNEFTRAYGACLEGRGYTVK